MDITASNLSTDAVRAFIEDDQKRKAEEQRRQEAAANAEREKLREAFLSEELPADAMERVASMVRKAVEMGNKQVLLFQFPSDWLPDKGRSITNHEPDWQEHLAGFAQRAHAYFERELKPRGFLLRAEIVDWPEGMPGDVGFFLRWKQQGEM